jgi:uncharacterized protein YcgI (DUF1989 family)
LSESFVLKARHGTALRLNAGARVTVVNTYGQQVVDTWALCASEPGEAMSMEHTRSCLDKLAPTVGDELFTDRSIECHRVPSPWNLFENVAIGQDGRLSIRPPHSRPGDRVEICALIDAIVVFSACPMDLAPTNGLDRCPRDVALLLED